MELHISCAAFTLDIEIQPLYTPLWDFEASGISDHVSTHRILDLVRNLIFWLVRVLLSIDARNSVQPVIIRKYSTLFDYFPANLKQK